MLQYLLLSVLASCIVVHGSIWNWDDKEFTNDEPGPRAGSLVTALDGSPSKFVVCGGYDSADHAIAGCGLLDAENNWYFQNVIPPVYTSPRSDGTIVSVDSWLILWGGKIPGADAAFCGECEIFDTRTWYPTHNKTCDGNVPVPRWGHSAVLHQNIWYIFGGALVDTEDTAVNDIYTLDLRPSNSSVFNWEMIPEPMGTDGDIPIPRHSHSSIVWTDAAGVAKMFIHGGYSFSERKTLSDLWYITISGFSRLTRWIQVHTAAPVALYGHTLLLHHNQLMALGGQLPVIGSGMRTLALDALEHDAAYETAYSDGWGVPETHGIGPQCPYQASIVAYSTIRSSADDSDEGGPPTPGTALSNFQDMPYNDTHNMYLTIGVFGGLHYSSGSICSSLHVLTETSPPHIQKDRRTLIIVTAVSVCGVILAIGMVLFLRLRRHASSSKTDGRMSSVLASMQDSNNSQAFQQIYTLRQLRRPPAPAASRLQTPVISIPHKPTTERDALLQKEASEPTLVWDLP